MSDTVSNSYYTQNDEERAILEYFGGYVGRLIDIGANDGVTFSNSARLIEVGWYADLLEPHGGAFAKCEKRYKDNDRVSVYNVGIAPIYESGKRTLYVNSDSLFSSLNKSSVELWGEDVAEEECFCWSWSDFIDWSGNTRTKYDFISIDAEGLDYDILCQMSLDGVKMVCFEQSDATHKLMEICLEAGMKKYYRSFENLIFVR